MWQQFRNRCVATMMPFGHSGSRGLMVPFIRDGLLKNRPRQNRCARRTGDCQRSGNAQPVDRDRQLITRVKRGPFTGLNIMDLIKRGLTSERSFV